MRLFDSKYEPDFRILYYSWIVVELAASHFRKVEVLHTDRALAARAYINPTITELEEPKHAGPTEHMPTWCYLRCRDLLLGIVTDRTLNGQVITSSEDHLLH